MPVKLSDIALHGKPVSELQGVTCHMESLGVTCHPTEVNAPCHIPQAYGPVLDIPTWRD